MSSPNDGGPAFPRTADARECNRAPYPGSVNGMSLRDWFAGQALAGMCVAKQGDADPHDWDETRLTQSAYKFADAMLAARNAKP
jgi:hypothetical protein